MKNVISGNAPLLKALKKWVPERRRSTPVGEEYAQLSPFLVSHPVPEGKQGFVFTSNAGDWLKVAKAGWTIYWCANSQPPYGTRSILSEHADWSMVDLCAQYFGVNVTDKRLVGDILEERANQTGIVLAVTSNTGGVGKTTSSRQLAQRATQMGVSTLLVDGNMRQSSQRSFFDPHRELNLNSIADWHPGMRMSPRVGATHGAKRLGVHYDVTFAPPAGVEVSIDHYKRYIAQARRMWQLIVLDLDRISASDLKDKSTMAGGLLYPSVNAGDLALVIVKAGAQTQADADNLLDAMNAAGMPQERVGVKLTIGEENANVPHDEFLTFDYTRFTFLGIEQQTAQAGRHIANAERDWEEPQLNQVREQVLAWALPDVGFTPDKYNLDTKKKKKGWRH